MLLGRARGLAETGPVVVVAEPGGALQGGHQLRVRGVQALQLRRIVGFTAGGLEPV